MFRHCTFRILGSCIHRSGIPWKSCSNQRHKDMHLSVGQYTSSSHLFCTCKFLRLLLRTHSHTQCTSRMISTWHSLRLRYYRFCNFLHPSSSHLNILCIRSCHKLLLHRSNHICILEWICSRGTDHNLWRILLCIQCTLQLCMPHNFLRIGHYTADITCHWRRSRGYIHHTRICRYIACIPCLLTLCSPCKYHSRRRNHWHSLDRQMQTSPVRRQSHWIIMTL